MFKEKSLEEKILSKHMFSLILWTRVLLTWLAWGSLSKIVISMILFCATASKRPRAKYFCNSLMTKNVFFVHLNMFPLADCFTRPHWGQKSLPNLAMWNNVHQRRLTRFVRNGRGWPPFCSLMLFSTSFSALMSLNFQSIINKLLIELIGCENETNGRVPRCDFQVKSDLDVIKRNEYAVDFNT